MSNYTKLENHYTTANMNALLKWYDRLPQNKLRVVSIISAALISKILNTCGHSVILFSSILMKIAQIHLKLFNCTAAWLFKWYFYMPTVSSESTATGGWTNQNWFYGCIAELQLYVVNVIIRLHGKRQAVWKLCCRQTISRVLPYRDGLQHRGMHF